MIEKKTYAEQESVEIENEIELEDLAQVPNLVINKANIKNMHITIYQSGCFGGADDGE